MNGKKRNYGFIAIGILLWSVFFLLMLCYARTKLTYIETCFMNEQGDACINLVRNGDELVQEFEMPYDILHGISVKVRTFDRDNNSEWSVYVTGRDSDDIICKKQFNASLLPNKQFYLVKFDRNIKLEKGNIYEIHINADHVPDAANSLDFYRSEISVLEDKNLYFNEKAIDGDLCFHIYGGDCDIWWIGFTTVLFVYLLVVIIRIYADFVKQRSLKQDILLHGLLVMGIVFLLRISFAVSEVFTDENDNIRGGMIIARGGVLYRDYVTQHTPVAYYLCAVFALLGASSVYQFRVMYYFTEALVWGALYCRHQSFFGKKKMILLPILEATCIMTLLPGMGARILADNVQALCTVALLLEALRYCKDKSLTWDRGIIASACIWGSLGSAFISAYALVWVVLIVVILEGAYWIHRKKRLKGVIKRYYKLVIAMGIPPICAIVYFCINHSFISAVRQFYLFNREVYSEYIGLGEHLTEPFIKSAVNFASLFSDNLEQIFQATGDMNVLLRLLIGMGVAIIVVSLSVRKKYVESLLMLTVMICSAPRGYGFHGTAAWYAAIMIITIFAEDILDLIPRKGVFVCGIAIAVIMTGPYLSAAGRNLLYVQSAVSEWESRVVSMTETGEGIFMDAYAADSIYLLYKDRYPVNRAVYMLPWYMDWYEEEAVMQLRNINPRIVLYNPDVNIWEYVNYNNYFQYVLREDYMQFSSRKEDGWQYMVWIRK